MINLIFAGWVVFSAYRGYRNGWLAMVFGLIAFVLAYVVCFMGTQALAEVFHKQGINSLYSLILAAVLLFSGTSFLVSTLPIWILKKGVGFEMSRQSAAGAVLGVLSGVVSGLLLLWAFSLVKSALALENESGLVEVQAKKIVGTVANAGIDLSGMRGIKADAAKALLKDPDVFIESLKSLAESKELKVFVNDKQVQLLMATNNIEGLMQTSAFVALSEHEGMSALLSKQYDGEKLGKRELAQNITQVWQRMQVLKHDPEIQAILRDPEVKKLVEENNPLALLANKKVQKIVDKVMKLDASKIDYSVFEIQETDAQNEIKTSSQQAIYEWRDDRGKIQFSDFDSIPLHKREGAVQVGGDVDER